MSHRATNWAIQQRGLEPATKLLLWQLADRLNADTGRCDPSQERLAHDCEMSRATVNRHLKKLEIVGLIQRIQRLDTRTKRQANTSYLLALDNGFSEPHDETRAVSQLEQEPSLKSNASRVSGCDTNPVREPGKKPVCAAETPQHTHPAFGDYWKAHPRPRDRNGSERLFAESVAGGVDPAQIIAAAKAYAVENTGNGRQYLAFSDNWLKGNRWEDHNPTDAAPKADSETVAVRIATHIIECKPWVISQISAHKARELIHMQLVTLEQCKAAGLAI